MSDLPARPPAPERRDQILDLLTQYFTAGRIELEDMERRMEIAARAATEAELDTALAGLRDVPAKRESPGTAVAAPMGPDRPKGRKASLAFMSGMNRRGRWFPAQRHLGVALMGGVVLDFREAELEPGTTDVSLWVMWGGVEIVVPPDLDVEVEGFAIMGGLRELSQHPAPLETQTRRLRVRARVLMGGVDVKVRARAGDAPGAAPPSSLPRRERKKLR
ncbi:MAG: hypothetical protein A2085_05985 [Gemmatimonadetes bacterium GWC2_71_10]|nr:MAG: hypothetical protein A2085_05985 [Gemmatimonadetes bacterium GWC2_71_10]